MSDSTTAESSTENRCDMHGSEALNSAGSEPSRRRWRESVKAIAPRQHVVHTRPSTPDDHQPRDVDRPAAFNRYIDEWKPRHPCSMSMDKALREMEFPSRLAGASWVLGE